MRLHTLHEDVISFLLC